MFAFIQNLLNVMNYIKSRKGQGMVEYGLIIGLMAIVVIGTIFALSGGL